MSLDTTGGCLPVSQSMKTLREKLADYLTSEGWDLARAYTNDLEWWAGIRSRASCSSGPKRSASSWSTMRPHAFRRRTWTNAPASSVAAFNLDARVAQRGGELFFDPSRVAP